MLSKKPIEPLVEDENQVEQLASLDGERGIPSINAKKRAPKKQLLVFCGLILVVGLGLAYLSFSQNSKKGMYEQQRKELREQNNNRTFDIPEASAPFVPEIDTQFQGGQGVSSVPDFASQEEEKPVLNKSLSLMMITNSNSPNDQATSNSGGNNEEPPISNQDSKLTSTYTPSVSAQRIGNRNMIIAKGTFINCGLQTRLDTTVQGMLTCRVTENVYSDNGKFVLIERGSIVTGEYNSQVEKGMNRVYVLWNRIKTPKGVVINIDSPASDSLGGAGIDGYVNTHFWKRFGGAILMSLVDDASQIIVNRTNKNNSNANISLDSTADSANELATEVLKNSINIPPTLYRNQGDKVGIFVARDLDFSGVYHVRAK